MQIDYAAPSNVTFIEGGLGHPFVKINIKSEPGKHIESTFRFKYRQNNTANSQMSVGNFLETEIQMED